MSETLHLSYGRPPRRWHSLGRIRRAVAVLAASAALWHWVGQSAFEASRDQLRANYRRVVVMRHALDSLQPTTTVFSESEAGAVYVAHPLAGGAISKPLWKRNRADTTGVAAMPRGKWSRFCPITEADLVLGDLRGQNDRAAPPRSKLVRCMPGLRLPFLVTG